jgi:putative ABC transport system ATP-binding protein
VALPLLLDGKNIQDYTNRIDDLLALVNLSDRRDHKPDQLSGGQQQRVAIARAFVNEPQIVLADEPTGNLDSRSGMDVLNLLTNACKTLNTTVVMVTHDPRAAAYADRVVFLKDGQIIQELASTVDGHDIQEIMNVMAALEL